MGCHSPAVCGAGVGAGFGVTFVIVAFFPGARFGDRCLALRFAAGAELDLAARTAAQRFLVAATMAARPAAESSRFAFTGSDGTVCRVVFAHRARWAAAIRALPAALMWRFLRRPPAATGAAACLAPALPSFALISAILAVMSLTWCW